VGAASAVEGRGFNPAEIMAREARTDALWLSQQVVELILGPWLRAPDNSPG